MNGFMSLAAVGGSMLVVILLVNQFWPVPKKTQQQQPVHVASNPNLAQQYHHYR